MAEQKADADSPLSQAEQVWLDETTEEEFWFVVACKNTPHQLRRHNQITGGLASLVFGGEKIPNGIFLGMIVSDVPKHGGQLLNRIVELAKAYNLSITGEIIALKPRDWEAARYWTFDKNIIARWYEEHRFRVSEDDNKKLIDYP